MQGFKKASTLIYPMMTSFTRPERVKQLPLISPDVFLETQHTRFYGILEQVWRHMICNIPLDINDLVYESPISRATKRTKLNAANCSLNIPIKLLIIPSVYCYMHMNVFSWFYDIVLVKNTIVLDEDTIDDHEWIITTPPRF